MITAGIDIGVENIKVVILKDCEIVGKSDARSGGIKRPENAKKVLEKALGEAGISIEEVEKIVATGKGKFDVESIVDEIITEPITTAKAGEFLCPEATTVFYIGADETMALSFKDDYKIEQFVVNEKCAAGIGSFIRRMTRQLGMTMEEINNVPVSSQEYSVSDGCVVFAELDAINLLKEGVEIEKIASASLSAAAVRACTVINDITIPRLDNIVVIGGLAQNTSFMEVLKERMKKDFVVPENAYYAPALGAALCAANWGKNYFAYN